MISWFSPAPAERLGCVRVLAGAFALFYLLARGLTYLRTAELDPLLFAPVGPVSLLDRPLPPLLAHILFGATLLAALPFLFGWRFSATGPFFALLLLWQTSYRSSFGVIYHSENLLALQLLVLAFSRSADAVSLDAARTGSQPPGASYGWPLKLLIAVAAAAYFVAGVAKVRLAGAGWFSGDFLYNQVAYNGIREVELGGSLTPTTAWFLAHPAAFVPLPWFTMVVELGAPLALLHPRLARAWAAFAVAFHWGILTVMWIGFHYPLTGIPFSAAFPLERALARLRGYFTGKSSWRWTGSRSRAQPGTSSAQRKRH